MAKIVRKELEQKLAALDGAEWDSMSESEGEGSDGDELKPPPLPLRAQQKKIKRKGKDAAVASVVPVGPAGEPSGVIYIGHIPHGFYEEAMNGFFKQFGDVIRVRISRSKKSARCKGYAYVEFVSPEVAQIVAETMNGYFLFDKQLVCRVLRFGEIHPNLFDGAGVKFRKVNWHGLYRQKYNADRTPEKDEKHTRKLLKKDKAKKDKLAKLGIDYDFPGFVATLKERQVAEGAFQEPRGADKKRNRKSPKAAGGHAEPAVTGGGLDAKDAGAGDAGAAGVEACLREGGAPSTAKKSPASKSSAAPAPAPAGAGAAGAAAPATSAKKGKGEGSVKTPTKKSKPSPAKGGQENAAVTPAAAAAAVGSKGGKSPGSGKSSAGKKKTPRTPDPAAAAGVVGSDGKGKKKGAKSPKSGSGSAKGKKRSLEEAEVAAAAAATPAAAAVTPSPGSGKKAKSAKRSRT